MGFLTHQHVQRAGLGNGRSVQVFRSLSDEVLQKIRPDLHLHSYKRNDVIFWQDDPSHTLHFIEQGIVRVYRLSPGGQETTINIANSGNIIDECAMNTQLHLVSAKAITPCRIWTINKEQFLYHIQCNAELMYIVHTMLINKVCWSTLYMETIIRYDVVTRLLYLILHYIHELGLEITPQQEYSLNLGVRQDDMASLIGTTRESVNRALRLWQKIDVLEYKDGNFLVKDLPWLKNELDRRIRSH